MSNRYYSNRLRRKAERRLNVRKKRARPKSFRTEEAAKKWAEANNVKEYSLKNLKGSASKVKKIVIVKK